MAELKTKKTNQSVDVFLRTVKDKQQQADSRVVLELFKKVTGEEPRMWGTSIVGFGDYRYQSERTGRGGDWFKMGFSPRKDKLVLYAMGFWSDKLLKKLGKYKMGGACLYIKRMDDVDKGALKTLLTDTLERIDAKAKEK